ncbi:MAG: hypothetical protein HY958_06790 [Bacteroidia bacterium]|nr:hypothetical protein [Bacteroidia bacterium]
MNNLNVSPPLTNMQLALLDIFATQIPDKHLVELRNIIARFLLEKARDKADKIWYEKGYNQQTLEKS